MHQDIHHQTKYHLFTPTFNHQTHAQQVKPEQQNIMLKDFRIACSTWYACSRHWYRIRMLYNAQGFSNRSLLSSLALRVVLSVGSSTVSINHRQCSCHVTTFDGRRVKTRAPELFRQQNYGKSNILSYSNSFSLVSSWRQIQVHFQRNECVHFPFYINESSRT